MSVLVDTSVWSLALRRKPGDLNPEQKATTQELAELVRDGRARIVGVIRQELLSGIQTSEQFETLRKTLSAFPDEPVVTADYEAAAQASYEGRAKDVAVSPVDIFICAVAQRRNMAIFSTDPDFEKYARVPPLSLHSFRYTR